MLRLDHFQTGNKFKCLSEGLRHHSFVLICSDPFLSGKAVGLILARPQETYWARQLKYLRKNHQSLKKSKYFLKTSIHFYLMSFFKQVSKILLI